MQLQDGLLKVTTELQTVSKKPTTQKIFHLLNTGKQKVVCFCVQAWRTYYQYHAEYVCAEGKLKEAEKQEEKQKQSAAKKLERLIEKVNKYTFMYNYVRVCVYMSISPLADNCVCATETR